MTNQEEEYELNYIKIDSKKEIRLLGNEDYVIEVNNFLSSALVFEQEQIGKKLEKSIKSKFPDSIDLLKINFDYVKEFHKSINSDKKSLYSSINRILSIDYKDKFIFSQSNVMDLCRILTIAFNDLKRYKLQSFKDFKNLFSKINFEKYDFFKIYANSEYLKSKEKEKIDGSFSRQSSQNKSTTFSSLSGPIKDLFDEGSSIDENNLLFNKNHNEAKGRHYIDNNIKNIVFSSIVDNYYNEENGIKKILTKECFCYPKYNKNSIIEKNELPLELILILYKFKNVNTLIFQIQNIEEHFIKMAIFIIINANWLFINGINEIKFDLGNDNLQYRINEVFKERTAELYHYYQKNRNLIYNTYSYKARTINLWEPETDMFFEKENDENCESNKEIKYLYNIQPYEETSTFDNHLCNIYNEFGNLTKLKYIRPINYTFKNQFNLYQNTLNEDFDESNSNSNSNYSMDLLNMSMGDLQRMERESISSHSKIVNQKLVSQNTINNSQSSINNDLNINKKTTPQIFGQFAEQKNNKPYFEMIAIYSYSIAKYFKKLAKLCLYFHKPYAYELSLLYKLNFDQPHFLIFMNKMENLTDVEFSFNSLDDKSFDYLLGIIYKNSNITSLKMSFFSSDINYCDDSLFNLCSAKKISLTKIFQDQKEYEIKHQLDKDIKINNFILNTKLLEPFNLNLCNFFNLLKTKTINKLNEIVMRFDLPIPILENKKYIILIIKFIINILIMLTFQENKIHTLKLLAPQLELNCTSQPYIRQFFKEISLKEEYDEEWEEKLKNEKDKKEKIRMKEKEKELKEQREKEKELNEKKKELKEKKERKELLQSINSSEDISTIPKVNNNNDDDNAYEVDVDANLENFDYCKRFNSVMQKNKFEQAARRNRSIHINSEDISNQKRSELNHNICLENLILQFKIYDLPEIFNICIKNNLSGLKSINIGALDETSFIGFMTSYGKLNNKLKNLTSLKIGLGITVLSFTNLEKYILDYININSPLLEEKYLFSNLQITNESKMDELFKLVYFKAVVPKLVIQIGYDNEHLLSKVIYKYILESKTELQSLIMIFMMDKYEKLRVASVLECLSSFYEKKKNKVIICKENPNSSCV